MTQKSEISKIETFLRRYPGCTFVYQQAHGQLSERFSVCIPVHPTYGGMIWGEGLTLDAAYCNALVRREDRVGSQVAA
jgi:hypothetical protein